MPGAPSAKPIGGHIIAHASQTRLFLRKGRGENRTPPGQDRPLFLPPGSGMNPGGITISMGGWAAALYLTLLPWWDCKNTFCILPRAVFDCRGSNGLAEVPCLLGGSVEKVANHFTLQVTVLCTINYFIHISKNNNQLMLKL